MWLDVCLGQLPILSYLLCIADYNHFSLYYSGVSMGASHFVILVNV